MKPYSLVTIGLILVAGCATTQSISVESRSRVYDQGYDQVFDAVVAVFAADGYAITNVDRENGIINTDERVLGGLLTDGLLLGNRMKVTALISNADEGTSVVLNISLTEANAEGGEEVVAITPGMARDVYRGMFAKIEAQLGQ